MYSCLEPNFQAAVILLGQTQFYQISTIHPLLKDMAVVAKWQAIERFHSWSSCSEKKRVLLRITFESYFRIQTGFFNSKYADMKQEALEWTEANTNGVDQSQTDQLVES